MAQEGPGEVAGRPNWVRTGTSRFRWVMGKGVGRVEGDMGWRPRWRVKQAVSLLLPRVRKGWAGGLGP